MARPLRIEFAGALYHVTSRGDGREEIFLDEGDRTREGTLAKGMRQLNGVYTQRFNRAHGRVGHVFQGRYKAILVQKDAHLLELARYVVLNPVRARMVRSAQEWRWSSYRAMVGQAPPPQWLTTDWLLAAFSRRRPDAIKKYKAFIAEGRNQPSPWESLRNQIFLGSEEFRSGNAGAAWG